MKASVGTKISLSLGFFLFPILLLGYFFHDEKQVLIRFTEQEIVGVRYFSAAHATLAALSAPQWQPDKVQQSLTALREAQAATGDQLATQSLSESLTTATADASARTAMMTQTLTLISTIADHSNITLDPDGDAYFIGDNSSNQLPALLSEAYALGLNFAGEHSNVEALAIARHEVETHAQNLATNYGKAFKNTADASLAMTLQPPADAVQQAVGTLLEASRGNDSMRVTSALKTLHESTTTLLRANNAAMEQLLDARIEGFYRTLYTRLGICALAVVLGTVVFVVIIRSILRAEKARAEDARARTERIQALTSTFEAKAQVIASTVAAAATELAQTASMMREVVDRSSQGTQHASENSNSINMNVQTVASAVEQMSLAIREIAAQTSKTDQLAQGSRDKTILADQQMALLSTAANEVNETVNLISSIAQKINLLALNATIESARAGAAGKGFAVVASEVKTLADQTNKSVQHVRSIIAKLNEASATVAAMVDEIRVSVTNTSEASSSIASAVEEQSVVTSEITSNMQTAAQGAQDIHDNLQLLSKSTADATTATTEVLTAARDLSQQSELLNQEVSLFLREMRAA